MMRGSLRVLYAAWSLLPAAATPGVTLVVRLFEYTD
jgi:hypothetical protein